ncbi:MAG: hypothetical protein IPH07_24165 [Deltaproteobacteria bacterium]|nr:hypothetical protein [Deltaproteobacteria bacterium]
MLYVLSAPDGRVALLHLEDLDRWSTARHHPSNPLRRKPLVRGVPVDQILVLGVCGQHGAVYELEAAERLVEGEDVASDRLAEPPRSDSDGGYRCDAASTWFSPPSDWDARLRAEDVGLFRVPRPLTELRDRGSLPHPRCPSDGPAYDEAAAMIPTVDHSARRRGCEEELHGRKRWVSDWDWVSAVIAAADEGRRVPDRRRSDLGRHKVISST